MKIRVTGTASECEAAREYYLSLGEQENVKSVSVSKPYANRNSVNVYRLYVDVEYYDDREAATTMTGRSSSTNPRTAGKLERARVLAALPNAGR